MDKVHKTSLKLNCKVHVFLVFLSSKSHKTFGVNICDQRCFNSQVVSACNTCLKLLYHLPLPSTQHWDDQWTLTLQTITIILRFIKTPGATLVWFKFIRPFIGGVQLQVLKQIPVHINVQAPCILYIGQAFHYSPQNAFYIFNQQIYFII